MLISGLTSGWRTNTAPAPSSPPPQQPQETAPAQPTQPLPAEEQAVAVQPEPTPDAEAVTPATAALQAGLPLLADDIDEQLLPIFLEEAVDLNQSISAQLRAWPEFHRRAALLAGRGTQGAAGNR